MTHWTKTHFIAVCVWLMSNKKYQFPRWLPTLALSSSSSLSQAFENEIWNSQFFSRKKEMTAKKDSLFFFILFPRFGKCSCMVIFCAGKQFLQWKKIFSPADSHHRLVSRCVHLNASINHQETVTAIVTTQIANKAVDRTTLQILFHVTCMESLKWEDRLVF